MLRAALVLLLGANLLTASSVQVDLRALSDGTTPLPAAWSGKSIFVIGAFHGVAENGPIDLALLTALQRPAGIRTFIAEISHAHAAYLNEYLATGDDRPLNRVMAGMRGFGDWTVQQRDFWRELRRWNRGLPLEQRVRIVGIDFERFAPEISLSWLRAAVDRAGEPPTPELAAVIQELANLSPQASLKQVQALADHWGQSLRQHSPLWQRYWGDAAYDARFVIANLQQRFECTADPSQFDTRREQVFYRNLATEAEHANLGGVFCHLGTAHALQRPFAGITRFAALLQAQASPWRGKVATVFPLYVGGQNLAVKQGHYHVVPNEDAASLVSPYVQAARSPWALFEMQGGAATNETGQLRPPETWTWANDRPTGGVTAGFVTTILLVTKSHAAEPLDVSP